MDLRFRVVSWKDEWFVHDGLTDAYATTDDPGKAEAWCAIKNSKTPVHLAAEAWYSTPREALADL